MAIVKSIALALLFYLLLKPIQETVSTEFLTGDIRIHLKLHFALGERRYLLFIFVLVLITVRALFILRAIFDFFR
jgi:hypothetical protein